LHPDGCSSRTARMDIASRRPCRRRQ
jgi:hypothetical protein